MSCCICNKPGHDEELHGEEGQEILELRERVLFLESGIRETLAQWGKIRPSIVEARLKRVLDRSRGD